MNQLSRAFTDQQDWVRAPQWQPYPLVPGFPTTPPAGIVSPISDPGPGMLIFVVLITVGAGVLMGEPHDH
jgi:hypothetical protein